MKKTALITLALLLFAGYGLWKLSAAREFQVFGELVSRVDIEQPVVALTFDDGPSAAYTGWILETLHEQDVRATFFLTGREMEQNPEQARRIAEAGHELGNHSWSHPRFLFVGQARIREEIEKTDAAIRRAGHRGPILFRPPYGKKLFGLPWYLARTGRVSVMWDLEPETYPEVAASAERIAAHVLENVRPGSIVLLHVMYESREESRKAVPLIIDGLRQRGYRFATVTELMRLGGG